MALILLGVAVALLAVGTGLAVAVRRSPTERHRDRPYRRPMVVVLGGMALGLSTIVSTEEPAVGALIVASLWLLAPAVVGVIAITDPDHTTLPPWPREPE